jgi:hypothetical protein
MDAFKRNIQGFRKRGSKQNVHKGGPCSCCTEADKRGRSRLARRRLQQQDEVEVKESQELVQDPQE